jgi:hypothetical protein
MRVSDLGARSAEFIFFTRSKLPKNDHDGDETKAWKEELMALFEDWNRFLLVRMLCPKVCQESPAPPSPIKPKRSVPCL